MVLSGSFAGAAHAETVPEDAVKLFLKNHADLPLAASDDGVILSADFDLWRFTAPEAAFATLGEYLIVHDSDGRCLTADTGGDPETAPVSLVECADAIAWEVEFDDANQNYRFTTPDGYFLGLADDEDAVEGAEVFAVMPESGESRHFQEWLTAAVPAETPPPPGDESSPHDSESESEAAKPALPTTGTALGAGIGGGALALVGGTALVLWWQRRRALRSEW